MKKIILLLPIILTSCIQTITIAHTEGKATDLIDQQESASADIKPNISPDINLPKIPGV